MSNTSQLYHIFHSKYFEIIPKTADLIHKAKVYRSISSESRNFAALFPLASYFVFMLAISIPDMFLSVAFGIPFIKVALTLDRFAIASFIWFLTYFCPRDIHYRIFNDRIVKVVVGVLCELNRKNVFSRLTERALKMSSRSYFSALLIPTFYCSAFMLSIYPLDQLMRGSIIMKHEAKSPHFGTVVVLMYAIITHLFLFARETNIVFLQNLGSVSLDIVHQSIMIIAIFLCVFHNFTGWDPLTNLFSIFTRLLTPRKVEATMSPDDVSVAPMNEPEVDDTEEVVLSDTPKRGRIPRKRRS